VGVKGLINYIITILGSGANAIAVHWLTGWRAFIVKLIMSVSSSSLQWASYSQLAASHPGGYRHDMVVSTVTITSSQRCGFCLRYAMLARVIAIAACPVCLSVHHKPVSCQNEESYRHNFFTSGSPTILVFWCQISSQNSKGFPRVGPQRKVGWENSAIF